MMNVYKSLQSYLGVPEDRKSEVEPKGIGSILNWSVTAKEDTEEKQRSVTQSLRRTLSADMSSQGWTRRENPLRKNCSSYELCCNNSDDSSSCYSDDVEDRPEEQEEEEQERDEHVFSLTDEEEVADDDQNSNNISESDDEGYDSWSALQLRPRDQLSNSDAFASLIALCGAKKESKTCSSWEANCKPRRSVTLSDKSLQLCTEGLGCESGSDCSSLPAISESGDYSSSSEDASVSVISSLESPSEDDSVVPSIDEDDDRYNDHFNLKVSCGTRYLRSTRSFPPPLTSISGANGPCVHMRSYKKDGRLLLQAVKVPSHNYLQAHREGGRLKLQFIKTNDECNNNNSHSYLPQLEPEHSDIESLETKEFVESADQLEEILYSSENINVEFRHTAASNSTPEDHSEDADSSHIIKQFKLNAFDHHRYLNSRESIAKSDHEPENLSGKEFSSCGTSFNFNFKPDRLGTNDWSLFNGVGSAEPEIRSSSHCKHGKPEFVPLIPPRHSTDICDGLNESDQHAADVVAYSMGGSSYVASNVCNGWKRESLNDQSSQSLMTTPSLLNYPISRICSTSSVVSESSHSMPKFPLKEGFGRCKERKCVSIREPYCVASS